MDIKLQEWEQNTDPAKPNILGHALVSLNEKMVIWMTVMKGSKGIFVKFPSIRIHNEFRSAISWPGQSVETKIREAIMPDLEKKLDLQPSSHTGYRSSVAMAEQPDW